jgi:hypothetical protein
VQYEEDAILAVKEVVTADLGHLASAAAAIQETGPAPDADGWSGGAEIDAGKAACKDARIAYERIEGAPEGRGYERALGEDDAGAEGVGDCNVCHSGARENDFVLSSVLELSEL